MSTLKVNQTFGLGNGGDRIGLVCAVESIDGADVKFLVINGLWNGTLHSNKTFTCHAPWGNDLHPVTSIYLGPVPKGSYEDQLEYMNVQFKKNKFYLYALQKAFEAQVFFEKLQRSIKASKDAFVKSWTGPKPLGKGFEDMDDDIPF